VGPDHPLTRPNGTLSWRSDPLEFVLDNGLRVHFTHRGNSAVVEFRLVVEDGFASDPDQQSGLAGLAMAMFSAAALHLGGAQLGLELEMLGAMTGGRVTADAAVIEMSALTTNLDDALGMFTNVLVHPEFKATDLELVRTSRIALITSELLNPFDLALRVLPPMVFGRDHTYARPLSGSGTKQGVASITAADLDNYYAAHLAPQSSTLVAVGACGPDELRLKLEKKFRQWRPTARSHPRSPSSLTVLPVPESPSVMLINRPGGLQAMVAAGLPTFARNSSRAEALLVADVILGGIFTSRLNLSLRENKGWTYGVRSSLIDSRLKGLWLIRSAVREDFVPAAMTEIACEIESLAGRRPCLPEEFARAVGYLIARMPCIYETSAQIAEALVHSLIYRLPLAYPPQLTDALRHLTPDDVTETCQQILDGGGPRWMVVGNAANLVDKLCATIKGKVKVADISSAEML
jgi:zinc protease